MRMGLMRMILCEGGLSVGGGIATIELVRWAFEDMFECMLY